MRRLHGIEIVLIVLILGMSDKTDEQERFRGSLSTFTTSDWREWTKLESRDMSGTLYKSLYTAGFADGLTLGLQVLNVREEYVQCLDKRRFSPKEVVAIADKYIGETAFPEEIRVALVLGAVLRKSCGF